MHCNGDPRVFLALALAMRDSCRPSRLDSAAIWRLEGEAPVLERRSEAFAETQLGS